MSTALPTQRPLAALLNDSRRQLLVYKKDQLRFALTITVYALFFGVFVLFVSVAWTTAYELAFGQDPIVAHDRSVVLNFVGYCIDHWWITVFAMVLLAFKSLLTSQRIFGPVKGLELALRRPGAAFGGPISWKPRRGDYFQDVASIVEEALNSSRPAGPVQAEESPREDREGLLSVSAQE